jgi:hypothetical protein
LSFFSKKFLFKGAIFSMRRLGNKQEGLSETEEKNWDCHLKKLVMTSLRRNQ